MDNKFTSPSKSDSGYSSSSSDLKKIHKNNEDKNEKLQEFFSDFITKIYFEDSKEWKSYLSEFKKKVETLETEALSELASIFLGLNNVHSEFSWKNIDNLKIENENTRFKLKKSKKSIGSAIREIAKSKTALEKDFLRQIIKEYQNDYKKENNDFLFEKDSEGNNVLHCVAIAIANKARSGYSISSSDWDVYKYLLENFKDLDVENNLFEKPSSIIEDEIEIEETFQYFEVI